ncbi:MAG: tRNA (adenosine(37)-N6)-dimethylallyltransferase MiaA [Candidatus Acidiferrales bacterium]
MTDSFPKTKTTDSSLLNVSPSPPHATERLIVVLGPTASGKSALALALAEKLDGEVLVCDSTQVYRHFDIGTAKVPEREWRRGEKNIAHHLIDLVEPDAVFTAGDYRRHALAALDDLRSRSKLPILAAGTGLYLRALLEGLADAPTRSEELRARLRAIAEARGPTHLHTILARLDRESAARIAPRDTQKIIRAIEMRVLTGKPAAEIFSAERPDSAPVRDTVNDGVRDSAQNSGDGAVVDKLRDEAHVELRDDARETTREGARATAAEGPRKNALEGYAVTKIGLLPPRAALYARIDARVEAMLAAGWLDEVRELVARGKAGGVPADAKPFQFIGYADLRAHLEGRVTLADAIARIQQATRRFAKRQLTWFRREADVHWLESFGDAEETTAAALALIARHANSPR